MSEVALQNILAEHAESLLRGSVNRDMLLAKYHYADDSEAARLMDLAERLYYAMPLIKPADKFVWGLYEELVGVRPTTFWGRWARTRIERLPALPVDVNALQSNFRQLPRHMQIAAAGLGGLTLIWIASRAVRENGHLHEVTNSAGRTA